MTQESATMVIGGNEVKTAETLPVVCPATEKIIAQVPRATKEHVDSAVAAARAAFPRWRDTSWSERQDALRAIIQCMQKNREELSLLLAQECGKPLENSRQEIDACIGKLAFHAKLTLPVEIFVDDAERRIETHHVPLGVVAALVPWNAPLRIAVLKLAPALLAGNCIVLKPSPFAPLAVLRLGSLLRDVLPSGVLNVLSGGDELGPWLTQHRDVNKVSFTGSTRTGRAIMAAAAADIKRVTLELGGNDAAIVCEDVDVEAIAPRLFWAAFRNSAQACIAAKRIYVHDAIYDRVAKAMVAYAQTVKIGDTTDPAVQMGPIQNRPQFERVRELLEQAKARGVRFLIGGDVPDGLGYFIPVAIVDNPPDDDPLVAEEAFGPVVPLLRFQTEADAIARANNTIYGLAGTVWSKDALRAERIARQLETGTVWINTHLDGTPEAPFAGHKQSGFGVENGLAGVLEYAAPRTLIERKHR